jgi:hypothetical protein
MASIHGTSERAPGSAGGVGACHACQTRLSRHRLRANYPRRRALTWQVTLVSGPSPCFMDGTRALPPQLIQVRTRSTSGVFLRAAAQKHVNVCGVPRQYRSKTYFYGTSHTYSIKYIFHEKRGFVCFSRVTELNADCCRAVPKCIAK